MIFENVDQIGEVIENPRNRDALDRGIEIKDKHLLHTTGIGLDNWLDIIQGIENEDAVSLRRALANANTVPDMAQVIRPMDKVFTAKGGAKHYFFSNENNELIFRNNILGNAWNGQSLNDWMQEVWKEKVNIDPFGLAFIEVSNKVADQTNLTYKSVYDIYDIEYLNTTNIEYVIFQPELLEKGIKKYRVVDDAFDYTVMQDGENFTIVEDETYPNYFGIVPAVILSNNTDKVLNKTKTTWVWESMIPADDKLLDATIHKLYKIIQGKPYVWEYERACNACVKGYKDNGEKCDICGGSGQAKNRSVTDIFIVPIPQEGEQPITPPVGYIQPDIKTWKQQEETLEMLGVRMFTATWSGASFVEKTKTNTTAFEVSVKKDPENNKLSRVSSNAELVEQAITDMLGSFHYPDTYEGSIIRYGKRFSIMDSSDLWEIYKSAVQSEAPPETLNQILTEYYYTLYENNNQELKRALNILSTKPFFHYNPKQVKEFEPLKIDYFKYLYYDQFLVNYEKTKMIHDSSIEEIQEALNTFAEEKLSKAEVVKDEVEKIEIE